MKWLMITLASAIICLLQVSTNAGDRLSNSSGSASPLPVQNSETTQSDYPSDIGVYMNVDKKWVDLNPEIANRKSGGVLKELATAGVVKGDVNGHINGASSPNHLSSPVELLVVAPEGVAITEYQLVRLHEQKNSREFRATTGGVFHESSGATRDVIPFDSKKVGRRTFLISLQNLKPGEYGLLPPGTSESASNFSLGKIYTFGIRE